MADLTRYTIERTGNGDTLGVWCTDCADPTNPLAPSLLWTDTDQVTELCLANLVAVAEQHEREHHADDEEPTRQEDVPHDPATCTECSDDAWCRAARAALRPETGP